MTPRSQRPLRRRPMKMIKSVMPLASKSAARFDSQLSQNGERVMSPWSAAATSGGMVSMPIAVDAAAEATVPSEFHAMCDPAAST